METSWQAGEWKIEREALGEGVAAAWAEVWTIAAPQRRNSLNRALVEELERQVARVSADRSVRAVVVTGEGDQAFCSGADLKDRAGMSHDDVRSWLELLHRTFRAIELAPQAFVAAINGQAFGGGLELALACDVRVADPSARMGLTEVALAIIPGGGGTFRLPRVVGEARAREWILTARRLGVEEALSTGLVTRLSPPGEVRALALTVAREIGRGGPLAVAQAKRALDQHRGRTPDEQSRIERDVYDPLLPTRDRIEGLAAFGEKRTPRYRGE